MSVVREQVDAVRSISISVVAATGSGPTSLAAFDDALMRSGVANFNLVRLSSVIPPDSVVSASGVDEETIVLSDRCGPADSQRPVLGSGGWGDRLYAVWAFQSAEKLGEEAWAGVAWVQDPADGRGLFVEHEASSEVQVREELAASLSSICESRSLAHLPQRSMVTGTRCEGVPVAALVIAPFRAEPW